MADEREVAATLSTLCSVCCCCWDKKKSHIFLHSYFVFKSGSPYGVFSIFYFRNVYVV